LKIDRTLYFSILNYSLFKYQTAYKLLKELTAKIKH
jgi:hypothetical protein